MNNYSPDAMKDNRLTPVLDYMTDGYTQWVAAARRRRKRRHVAIVAATLLLAVGVNATAYAIPMRYSTYDGSYGPAAVPVVEYLLSKQ